MQLHYLKHSSIISRSTKFFKKYIHIDLGLKQIHKAVFFHKSNFTAKLTNPNYIEQLHFEVVNSILMIKQSLNSILTIKHLLNSIIILKQSLDLILKTKRSLNSKFIIEQSLDSILVILY